MTAATLDAGAMRRQSRQVAAAIVGIVLFYGVLAAGGLLPHTSAEKAPAGAPSFVQERAASAPDDHAFVPPFWTVIPFATLLLCIALLPITDWTSDWWHHNKNRFTISVVLGGVTLVYYGLAHPGGIVNHFTHSEPTAAGWETLQAAFSNAILFEFVPFFVLLFCLYVISGGLLLKGDLPAHPLTNCAFLAVGTALASFIGTTGAAMALIRPLLATNQERRHKVHTVVFFIFTVCNCGGLLLPIGDPPLFLGYLRGVHFGWTLHLWPYWLGVNGALIAVYYFWDRRMYKSESPKDIRRDETEVRPLRLTGSINLIFLTLVVLCVAFIIPERSFLGTPWEPPVFFREIAMLSLVVLSLLLTKHQTRVQNRFDYHAIIEVGALFCGIFVCMQAPIEILHAKGDSLPIHSPLEYFWATGVLSSFLDNAPTYVVFFETAVSLPSGPDAMALVSAAGATISESLLIAISLAAVFMGANTYIGNGPNFMVRSIAEKSGVRMPSFFHYMFYSIAVLGPIYLVLSFFI